jgi:hypothetical protein
VNRVCRWCSRVVERVRLHKELKVSYRQDKAEPPRRQNYVDRVGLERLVPDDHSQVHAQQDCIEEGIVLRLKLPLT